MFTSCTQSADIFVCPYLCHNAIKICLSNSKKIQTKLFLAVVYSRQCIGLLDVRPRFKTKFEKIYFRRLPLSRFLANKIAMKCQSRICRQSIIILFILIVFIYFSYISKLIVLFRHSNFRFKTKSEKIYLYITLRSNKIGMKCKSRISR